MFNVYHFDISGKDINEEQPSKIESIYLILFVFHFEISGKILNEEQFLNIHSILISLFVFHFDISGNFLRMSIHKIDCT